MGCYIISMKFNPWRRCEGVNVEFRNTHLTQRKKLLITERAAQLLTFVSNMSHLHLSVQPISNNDTFYKTTCHEKRLWLNDKRIRNFRSFGSDSRLPRCFLYRRWWRGSNRGNSMERDRGLSESGTPQRKMWEKQSLVSEEESLFEAQGKERGDNGEPFYLFTCQAHMFHGEWLWN